MNFMAYLTMEYDELPKRGAGLQLRLSLLACRALAQQQTGAGVRRGTARSVELHCAGALDVLLSASAVTRLSAKKRA